MQHTSTPSVALVDILGQLKADAADIKAEMDSAKEVLIAREGECKLEGELFRAALSHTLTSRVKWEAVARTLASKSGMTEKAFNALLALHTDCTDSWTLRVSARITK